MPILKNIRHEHFAQGVAKGMSQTQAYIEAGYASSGAEQNASRLMSNDKVAARVAELQERGAIRAEITIADLVTELEEARGAALSAETPQSSAAVAATMGKAKLLGLVVDKLAGADGGPLTVQYLKPRPTQPDEGYDSGE